MMAWAWVVVSGVIAAASYFVCAHVRATSIGLVSALMVTRTLETMNGGHAVSGMTLAVGYVLLHTTLLLLPLPAALLLRLDRSGDLVRPQVITAKMAAVSPPIFLVAESWFWIQLLLTLGIAVLVARDKRANVRLGRIVGLYATLVWFAYAAVLLVGPGVPLSEMP